MHGIDHVVVDDILVVLTILLWKSRPGWKESVTREKRKQKTCVKLSKFLEISICNVI